MRETMDQTVIRSASVKRPIRGSVILGLFFLVFTICFTGGIVAYHEYHHAINDEYEYFLGEVVRFSVPGIAADDLQNLMRPEDAIHRQATHLTLRVVIPLFLLSLAFSVFFAYMIDRNITMPLNRLEERTQEFASVCDHRYAPEILVFNRPDIHTKNEVESLSYAIARMAQSIRFYAEDIRTAEDQTMTMTLLAYRDSLTHVKNATAYEVDKMRLEGEILNGNARFAFVFVDINDLKQINDNHGHEFGDEYIIGVCRTVCDIFRHSSVFRIGGDEFLVILQGRDYDRRDDLMLILRQTFAQTARDESVVPWRRYSAAAGLAIYKKGDTVKDVFHRADEAMYHSKLLMKQNIRKEPLA